METARRRACHVLVASLAIASPAAAGSIGLAWNPVPGATGYRVYYGSRSGDYTSSIDAGATNRADLSNLSDCTTYFVAVKAYGPGGTESARYSDEIVGWAHPEISTSPVVAKQGDRKSVTVRGANFDRDATVSVVSPMPLDLSGAPLVRVEDIEVVSCREILATVTLESATRGVRAAPVGDLDVAFSVTNPDGVVGGGELSLTIDLNPARCDVNRSNETTRDRVDGLDLAWLTYAYGTREGQPRYFPDADLDGSGDVDGVDLAYLAGEFGHCWDGTQWTLEACR